MGATSEWCEMELRLALLGTASVAAREARREAREELDMRLALEESGNDYWWSQMPPQLCWLRRPDSLQQLLQRPVWLSKWRRDEEKRAALLWGKLPDTLINIVLDFRDQLVRQERLAEWCRACYRHIRAHQRRHIALEHPPLLEGFGYVTASRASQCERMYAE